MGWVADAGNLPVLRFFAFVAICTAVCGCTASLNNPERLVPVPVEMEAIKASQFDLGKQYNAALSTGQVDTARNLRNELIAERMYAIDVQYSQYEAALTQETQKIGFAALTTAEGVGTAATLFTPAVTKSILTAVGTAIVATKGYYDSEVLLALTMRTIQKQMRASRNQIAEQINRRMGQGIADYPLASALSDLEDYYRAGTLTSGVIDASTTVGAEEKGAEERKQIITRLPLAERPSAIITDVNAPIPRPVTFSPPPPGDSRFNATERGLQAKQIKRYQQFVCAKQSGLLGPLGSETRIKIRDYLVRNTVKPSTENEVITDDDRINLDEAIAAKKSGCPGG